jgi:chromosome segregation ATPase
MRKNILNHPFYAEANQYRETVRREQVLKGAHKYPEPFTTESWTNQEIIDHAMQENVDQAHYIYAAKERMEELERELKRAESAAGEYQQAYKNVCAERDSWHDRALDAESERDEFKKQYIKAHAEIQDLQYKLKVVEKPEHDCSKNQGVIWKGKDIVKVYCSVCNNTLYEA